MAQVCGVLAKYRFNFRNESELQSGVAAVLRAAEIPFEEQVAINPLDRLDFLCDRLALELKVRGDRAGVIRQVHRYCESELVESVLIVSSRYMDAIPASFFGKPVGFMFLRGYL